MLAGIREVLIISTPHDLPLFRRLLGDGSEWGMRIDYAEQATPIGLAQAFVIGEEFVDGDPAMLVLGDNIFYGAGLTSNCGAAAKRNRGATMFAYHVPDPERYGVVEFDRAGRAISIERSPKAEVELGGDGPVFLRQRSSKSQRRSNHRARGEYEITDVNRIYLEPASSMSSAWAGASPGSIRHARLACRRGELRAHARSATRVQDLLSRGNRSRSWPYRRGSARDDHPSVR